MTEASDQHGRTALAISGGGFRAALFHLGSLVRLNELGWLHRLDTVTSVSGGSVLVGYLAYRWGDLEFDKSGVATNFDEVIVAPVRRFCTRRIDTPAFLKGLLLPFKPTGWYLARAYRRFLFGDAKLADIPADGPRFVFLATSLQTGKNVRFYRDQLYDYTIGRLPDPDIEIATAVAASSAFPPLLSPVVVNTDPESWVDTRFESEDDVAAFRGQLRLIDGGTYDNLGLEPVWKAREDELDGHFDTVLVSDAGAPLTRIARPSLRRFRLTTRMIDVMTDQPRALRKRELIERFQSDPQPYGGCYWGISTKIDNYGLDDPLVHDNPLTASMQHVHTRLTRMAGDVQGHLINWGYALADAAMRRHVLATTEAAPPPAWPLPENRLDRDPHDARNEPVKKIPKKKWIPATIGAVLMAVVALGLGFVWYKTTWPDIPAYVPVEKLVHLEQGWTKEQRRFYYRTPQGTEFFGLRYDWLAAFERPFGKTPLITREFMMPLGFIYEEKPPTDGPDMPIGFTWHEDPATGDRIFDLTCAACHSSQLRYGDTTIRIDGGPGLHSFPSMKPDQFLGTMTASLFNTWANPLKFRRFARKVLGDDYPQGKSQLRRAIRRTLWQIIVFAKNNPPKLYPTEEGFGRTDALGRIGNTVFGDEIDSDNYRVANAPVNYPHLWDIWLFDWVQWMGSVPQPMARNVNEALGTRAKLDLFDDKGRLLPEEQRFDATVRVEDIHCLEVTLQHLLPPEWPAKILGAPDKTKAEIGRELFSENCAACHGPHRKTPKDCTVCHGPNSPVLDNIEHMNFAVTWRKALRGVGDDPPSDPAAVAAHNEGSWKIPHIHIDYIGTDPTSAANMRNNRFDLSAINPQADGAGFEDPTSVKWADGLKYIGGRVKQKKYDALGLTEAERDDYDGYLDDAPKDPFAYRPRPLEAIWATPPYLHNGSVPTIYDLLLPEHERPARFYLGRNEYDPRRLGLVTRPFEGAFEYDTSITGNANSGHAFDDGLCGNGIIGIRIPDKPGYCRALKPAEIEALLEYLKVHKDATATYPRPKSTDPHCADRWVSGGAS